MIATNILSATTGISPSKKDVAGYGVFGKAENSGLSAYSEQTPDFKIIFHQMQKDTLDFEFSDSGKMACFTVQVENEGKKGPWGPFFRAHSMVKAHCRQKRQWACGNCLGRRRCGWNYEEVYICGNRFHGSTRMGWAYSQRALYGIWQYLNNNLGW